MIKQDLKSEFVKTDSPLKSESFNQDFKQEGQPQKQPQPPKPKVKRQPKVYETSYDRCNYYDYFEMKDLEKVLGTSKGELDRISKSRAIINHFSYSNKSFKLFKYICKSSRGDQSNGLTSIKKTYLRALVNLTERFKLKFNDEKYFSKFMALLEQKDKREGVIELVKYFFALFEESNKSIVLKVGIQFMKDFINVIEVLKAENP